MGVVGDQSGSHTAGEDVNGDTERNEETSRNSVHAGEVGNGSGTPKMSIAKNRSQQSVEIRLVRR